MRRIVLACWGSLLVACGNGSGATAPREASTLTTSTGASCDAAAPVAAPLGAPCVPDEELDPSFPGFPENEISFESRDPQCASRICLVNHFRGRVTCPYGQDSNG